MKITLKEVPIRDLTENYSDTVDGGVVGYDGKLNIRPAYQREFVYKDRQRKAVIETVIKNFPLNVMYWVKNDNTFEVLDGQQRSISICQYIEGAFSIDEKYFHNLTHEEREQILNYKLMIYECTGTAKEKLDWFRTINIAGEKLTPQELRNAIYTGQWLTEAKKYFSKPKCPANEMYKNYLKGSAIRQDYLETAITWISNSTIDDYMAIHQHDENADELWEHFKKVMDWVHLVFPTYRKEMKGIDWGKLYNPSITENLDSKVNILMLDEEVEKKRGVYEYLLTGNENVLSLRVFKDTIKREVYEEQKGKCKKCLEFFEMDAMEGDHITPYSKGGKTIKNNCQMLCRECNRRKSNK